MPQVTIETSASHAEKIDFVTKHLAQNNSQFNKFPATADLVGLDLDTFISSLNEQGLNNLLHGCKALALQKMPSNIVLLEYDNENLSKFEGLTTGDTKFRNKSVSAYLHANSYDDTKENFKRFTITLKCLVSDAFSEDQKDQLFADLKQVINNQ